MKYSELLKELAEWEEENIISKEQFEIIKNKYKPEENTHPRFYSKFSSKNILTFITIIIVILGTMAWMSEIVPALNDVVVIGASTLIAFGILYFGDYLEDRNLNVIKYVGKFMMIIGSVLFTFLLFYLDYRLSRNYGIKIFGDDWSLFMIVSALILLVIGYIIREKEIIAYSILVTTIWFISQGKINTGEYFGVWLGVTFATRLIVFSLVFMGLGYLHMYNKKIFTHYKIFSNTYLSIGLLLIFIATFQASLGNWLTGSLISLRVQSLIFLFLGFGVSIYSIYHGLIKDNSAFINQGLVFFGFLVFGNLYKVFSHNIKSPLFYILLLIVGLLVGVVIEYTLTHKKELKKELLNNKKG